MWRAVRSLAPRPRTRTPAARAVPRQAGVGNPGVTVPSIPRRYPLGVYWAWFCKVDVRHSARVPCAQRLSVCERAGRQAGRGRGRTLIRLVVMTSKRGRAATLLTGLAGGTNGWLCSERTSAPNVTARHALLYTFSVRWARGAPRKSRSTLISNRTDSGRGSEHRRVQGCMTQVDSRTARGRGVRVSHCPSRYHSTFSPSRVGDFSVSMHPNPCFLIVPYSVNKVHEIQCLSMRIYI
jgi:hypothetical protein